MTDAANNCHRNPASHGRHHQEFRRTATAIKIDSIDSPTRRTTSRQRKRAAGAALGALVLTTGVTAAVDTLNDYAAIISAGRLTINLADHGKSKSDSCSNDTLDITTDTSGNDDDNYLQVFAANSNNYDGGLANPFLGEAIPVRIEIVDIWDLVEMLNDPVNQPIELLPLNPDTDNQNQN
ncbi:MULTISPECIES: hypothetical protein [Mycobacterium]|uniref:hypothetical protein n=1 Tax=Mycobacterium TaxID=1763 RepID=UPI0009F4DE08|nr:MULTISPECIES: hypothetical protein [Mycobacterium]ORB32744.1 hypothetical protein BST40_27620 [Mycobacterium persicum]ORB82421.1 hypothetical protein B1T49_28020 [Mycobacterium persicum]ORB82489.1 hypothetical protein B1T44_28970 [Mycobacterium persicum]ORB98769.1 hypothetical protein B1T48_28370 [Mycobacterium persicum]